MLQALLPNIPVRTLSGTHPLRPWRVVMPSSFAYMTPLLRLLGTDLRLLRSRFRRPLTAPRSDFPSMPPGASAQAPLLWTLGLLLASAATTAAPAATTSAAQQASRATAKTVAGAADETKSDGRQRAPLNVLLIVADDLNTELGCYGQARVRTPNLDRLAARGVRFDRAYCQYPLCNPSRASFLSGRRPESLGVYILQTGARKAAPDAVMLPELFRRAGHRTEGAGKVYHSLATNDPASWDSYEDRPSDDPDELASIKRRYEGGRGEPTWEALSGDGSLTRDGRNSRLIAARIVALARDGKPFFLAAGFHKPHLPWNAPKRFFDLYDPARLEPPAEPPMRGIPPLALQTELAGFGQPTSRAGAIAAYYACVSFMDDNVGRVLDALRDSGQEDRTLVAFVGDNGFHLGDHGGLWAKHTAFDRATRVPLILAGPGIARGITIDTPVELLDLYPTLASLAGLTPPPGLEGRDLSAGLARGGPAQRAGTGTSAVAGASVGTAARMGEDSPTALAPRPVTSIVFHYDVAGRRDVAGRTVLFDGWRYTEWGAAGADARELYDLRADAAETANLIADPAASARAEQGARLLRALPPFKPGPANRPRALDPNAKKKS